MTSAAPQDGPPILCCPCPNRSPLSVKSDWLECNHTPCDLGSPSFPFIRGVPAIINEEQSILDFESIAHAGQHSPVHRPSSFQNLFTKAVFGAPPLSSCNVNTFSSRVHDSGRALPTVLIIGGATPGSGVDVLYHSDTLSTTTLDIYPTALTDVIADAHILPFESGYFDGVVIQAVLEHVLEPSRVVNEAYRVLSPRGIVYAESPFMQQVHEGAYDFFRFSHSAHRWLFRHFEELDAGVLKGPWTALLWSLRYAIASLIGSKRLAAVACGPLFWLRYLDPLASAPVSIDAASEYYFLGRKQPTPVLREADMPNYYAGGQ